MSSLPVARNTNYTPASPVRSSDLNDIQDCIVGRKKPPWTRVFWPKIVYPGPFTQTVTGDLPALLSSTNTRDPGIFEIPCDEGDRITGLSFYALGTASPTVEVYYASTMAGFGTPTFLSTFIDSRNSAVWTAVPMRSFIPQVIEPGGGVFFTAHGNSLGYQIGLMRATFDRL